jgi:hypothetical protein
MAIDREQPINPVTCYLTKEQAARIAAITIDALVGCQIHTDASDETIVLIDMVPIDAPYGDHSEHYKIHSDGSYAKTT